MGIESCVGSRSDVLAKQPIPELSPLQMLQFTRDKLLARESGRFDILKIAEKLRNSEGMEILTIDIGGTGMRGAVVCIKEGGVIEIDEARQLIFEKQGDGKEYLEALQKMAELYPNLPTAVCSAGVVENNTLLTCPNAPGLVEPLRQAGGFSGIFQKEVPLMNDAEAGVLAAAVGVAMRDGKARPIIYYIKSGGIGGATMDEFGNRTSLEPGHTRLADPKLNPDKVTTRCNLFPGWIHVCLERIAASGAGIEASWLERTGHKLSAKEIAELMYKGDKLALRLYSISAFISAHIIEGIRSVMNFSVEDTAVVLSGGAFKTRGMAERISSILAKNGKPMELIKANDLGFSSAGPAGLAISALCQT